MVSPDPRHTPTGSLIPRTVRVPVGTGGKGQGGQLPNGKPDKGVPKKK